MRNREFFVLLHARGETLQSLARKIGAKSHAPLSQMIAGQRSGKETWPKLEAHLTERELSALGRTCPSPQPSPRGEGGVKTAVVAGETMLHVEQTNADLRLQNGE